MLLFWLETVAEFFIPSAIDIWGSACSGAFGANLLVPPFFLISYVPELLGAFDAHVLT